MYDLKRSRRGQTGPGGKGEEETTNAVLVPATTVSQMSKSMPSDLVAEGLLFGVESNGCSKNLIRSRHSALVPYQIGPYCSTL